MPTVTGRHLKIKVSFRFGFCISSRALDFIFILQFIQYKVISLLVLLKTSIDQSKPLYDIVRHLLS